MGLIQDRNFQPLHRPTVAKKIAWLNDNLVLVGVLKKGVCTLFYIIYISWCFSVSFSIYDVHVVLVS